VNRSARYLRSADKNAPSLGNVDGSLLSFLVFRFGKPETAAQWIGHIVAAIVALFIVWWMFEAFVLR
jgi:hypothetical protein